MLMRILKTGLLFVALANVFQQLTEATMTSQPDTINQQ